MIVTSRLEDSFDVAEIYIGFEAGFEAGNQR
jgi:hypothetical protein